MSNLSNSTRLSQSELRAMVTRFETEQLKKPQVELKVFHHFSKGVYARELHIPAGMEVTGAIHKHSNMNTLSMGSMLLVMEDGLYYVKAPYTVASPSGTKRAALSLTDCVWTTYFGTDETDPEKILREFTTNDEQQYLAMSKNLTLEGE
jgi:hypothetical protein